MPSSVPTPAPTQRRNLAREVLLALRTEIISGKLQPGNPLAEPVLAKQFGSSRAPVREALIELEREGLVQFEPTGRTKVRTLTERDFAEIREARMALESMAARRAAAMWTPQDSEYIEGNITRQEEASTLAELSNLDVELHAHVMRTAGNQRLLALWQNIRSQFEMCLAFTHRLQQTLGFKPRQITVTSHRVLLAALASGNPEVAAQKMSAHIENSLEWFPVEPSAKEDPTKGSAKPSRPS
jgi:DNA-binding GntR family transcriptional regulator